MKALVYEGVEELAIRQVPDPVAGDGEQLIRIEAVGICGSDMHGYLGHDSRRPAPLILGHEAAGTIAAGARKGERVTINPLVSCGKCPACLAKRENICPERQIISMPPREGAFAQFVAMPEQNLVTIPDGYETSKAALVEPMAVSWHAAKLGMQALHPAMDRRALVLGGGAIGLAAALCLKALGCDDVVISEPTPERRAFLQERCGQKVVATPTEEVPLVIDAVGIAPTRATASALTSPGGVIVHVGLGSGEGGVDVRRMTLQEITLIGSYTYSAQDFVDCAHAMFEGRLGPMDWTETRALEDGQQAFQDLKNNQVASPKIVLDPWF